MYNKAPRKNTKYVEESEDSFYVTLRGGGSETKYTTEFTNKLYQPLYLMGAYEVAVSNVFFSNVTDLFMGEIEISYNNGSYVLILDVQAKIGDQLKNVFEKINEEIHEMVKVKEYERRLKLRVQLNLDKSEHLVKYGDDYISLPSSYNKIYDDFVYNDIKKMTPKLILDGKYMAFETTSEFSFKFRDNWINLYPDLSEKTFNVLSAPIYLADDYLPDFKTLLFSTNIIDFENFGDSKQHQILKIMNFNENSRTQSQNIGREDMTFQKIKTEKNNIFHTKISEINIKIYPDISRQVLIKQGEVIIRLFFRKISPV